MDGIPVIDAIAHADDSSEDNFANDHAVQIVDEAASFTGAANPSAYSIPREAFIRDWTTQGSRGCHVRRKLLRSGGQPRPADQGIEEWLGVDAAPTPGQGLAAHQAVAQNPDVVVMAAQPTEIVAAGQVFQQAGVPVITEASPNDLLLPKPKPWFYGIYPTSAQFAQSFLQGARDALGDLKGKRIAFSGLDTPDVNGVFTQALPHLLDPHQNEYPQGSDSS
jgi:hypothetical protein